MKISHFFLQAEPVISFEFFPPKTEDGVAGLFETLGVLKALSPSFVSMTYGAGGSTREKTIHLVSEIRRRFDIETVAHLTCVGHSQTELLDILNAYEKAGVHNVLALRGDPPKGETKFVRPANGFQYAAELVRFIKERFPFCVGVAGYPEKHPEALTLAADVAALKEKMAAGGDYVVTQLFFNNAAYFSYVKQVRLLGITAPVVPGIMPITDADQITRFSAMCGATIPSDLASKLESVRGDKAEVKRIGVQYATRQCEDLLKGGAPGLHFYTLNKSDATLEIFRQLRNDGFLKRGAQ